MQPGRAADQPALAVTTWALWCFPQHRVMAPTAPVPWLCSSWLVASAWDSFASSSMCQKQEEGCVSWGAP